MAAIQTAGRDADAASLRPAERTNVRDLLFPIVGLVLVALAVYAEFRQAFFTHDRSRNYVSRDFAAAILGSLPRDAILFTNGDNDTFPLWYAQEVEGIRKDVRVVNLSLLNTPWYVRQVRDRPPRVPMTLTDDEIAGLQAFRDQTGRIVLPKDIAVSSIIVAARGRQPVLFAFSVPDAQAFEGRLKRHALTYEVMPDPVPDSLSLDPDEVARTLEGLSIRGLFAGDSLDPTVYRDEITYGFLQNGIAMARFELGIEYRHRGRMEAAVNEMLRAARVAPRLPFFAVWAGRTLEEMGQEARAESLYRANMARYPNAYEFPWRLGALALAKGRREEGTALLTRAASMSSATFEPTRTLVEEFLQHGDARRAIQEVSSWLDQHPGDTTAQKILSLLEATTGTR